MFASSAFLFLAEPKRVSAEKTQKVRTDLHWLLSVKNNKEIKVPKLQFDAHGRWWDGCFPGDSFVVNAFLRRGMEECERYGPTEHKLKPAQVWTSVRPLFLFLFLILPSQRCAPQRHVPLMGVFNEIENGFKGPTERTGLSEIKDASSSLWCGGSSSPWWHDNHPCSIHPWRLWMFGS